MEARVAGLQGPEAHLPGTGAGGAGAGQGPSTGVSDGSDGGDTHTEDHRFWSLGETLESSVGGEDLFEEGTSENKALRWLSDEDPLQMPVTVTLEELLERFIMANFYFATNGSKWKEQYNFLSGSDVCDWNGSDSEGIFKGVRCEEGGTIAMIDLSESGLTGSIPDDIGLLTDSKQLFLAGNKIGGTLPQSLGLMRDMEVIDI
ncbi:MAG: hypothetical protein SGARI_000555, partial [Bacillariaceae sp.]